MRKIRTSSRSIIEVDRKMRVLVKMIHEEVALGNIKQSPVVVV